MAVVAAVSIQAADVNFVPLLFVAYIVYAIIASLVKAAKQVAQASTAATSTTQAVPVPQVTAEQVRAALARRVMAAAAARSGELSPPTPVVQRMTSPVVVTSVGSPPASSVGDLLPALTAPDVGQLGAPADFAALMASLPPAAQAVVAAAVIGPCAAHRGGGHNPEDW